MTYKPNKFLAFLVGLLLPFFATFVNAEYYCVNPPNVSGSVLTTLVVENTWIQATDKSGYTYEYGSLYYWTSTGYVRLNTSGYSGYPCDIEYSDYPVASTFPYEEPEPSICSNGVMDSDESGIDCGGICSDACDSVICANPSATLVDGVCLQYVDPDSFGNCPSGSALIFTDSGNVCSSGAEPPIQYFSGDVSDPVDPEGDDLFADLVTEPLPDYISNQVTVTESTQPSVITDNGDGTSTVSTVTTTTTVDASGDSYTTTETNSFIINNSTGETVAGSESTTLEKELPDVTAPNLNPAPESLDFGSRLSDLLNDTSAKIDGYVSEVQNSQLVQNFTDVFNLPADVSDPPALTISMGSYGVHEVDSGAMDIALSVTGQILVVCAFITGAFIVFRKQ